MKTFKPEIHPKLAFLLTEHWRYKVAYGGRGGCKSYNFADAAIARMIAEKITVTAGREKDNTILDSIHRLIKERIYYHFGNETEKLWDISNRGFIYKPNQSELTYIHFHNNKDGIRGLQGTMICWVFEAGSLSKESADELIPTIRMPGSEFWLEFNPDNDDDYVMTEFVYKDSPDCKKVYLTYLDNPLCPQVLIDEANKCKALAEKTGDFEDYNHIWLGFPSKTGSKIYPMFDKQVHIREYDFDNEHFKANAMFFTGQDPATCYYPFQVWIARIYKSDKEFDYLIYNEFPTVQMMKGKFFWEYRNETVCNLSLSQRAKIFKVVDNTIDKRYDYIKIKARGIDTRFAKASGAASATLGGTKGMIYEMALPQNGGLSFETPPEHRIDVQRDVIKGLFEYDTDLGVIPGINEPHLFVMPHCHNVIDAFEHHRIDNQKKSEDQKRKDPIDAIRICFATMEGHSHTVRELNWQEKTDLLIKNSRDSKGTIDILKEAWA